MPVGLHPGDRRRSRAFFRRRLQKSTKQLEDDAATPTRGLNRMPTRFAASLRSPAVEKAELSQLLNGLAFGGAAVVRLPSLDMRIGC